MDASLVKLTLLDGFAATESLGRVRADPAHVLWKSIDLEACKPSDKIFEDNFQEVLAFVTQWPNHPPSTPDMHCGFSAFNDVAHLAPLRHTCKDGCNVLNLKLATAFTMLCARSVASGSQLMCGCSRHSTTTCAGESPRTVATPGSNV